MRTREKDFGVISKYKRDGRGCHRGQLIVRARRSGEQLEIAYCYSQNSSRGVSETEKQQAVGVEAKARRVSASKRSPGSRKLLRAQARWRQQSGLSLLEATDDLDKTISMK